MSKIILMTGSSTGLGVAIAVQAGHSNYATMRDMEKRVTLDPAAVAAGVSLNVIALNVQENALVDIAVAKVIANEGRIDVPVNHADAGFVRSTEQASEGGIQWIMDVNFMGVVRCTKAVLPHIRQARGACGVGHIGRRPTTMPPSPEERFRFFRRP